jgi:5-formyltetrahydrofolate cyclo-ligase
MGAAQQAAASHKIAALLFDLPEFQAARGVHCFLSVPGELDTAPIFAACAAAGKATYVPVQLKAERRLACVAWQPGDPLVEGPYGIREPLPGHRPPVDVAAIDLVLAPGAAFDRGGNRLGYGMAYYDSFLKSLADLHGNAGWAAPNWIAQPNVIALAFAVQLVPEVPVDPWDIRLPAVLTEQGLIQATDTRPR